MRRGHSAFEFGTQGENQFNRTHSNSGTYGAFDSRDTLVTESCAQLDGGASFSTSSFAAISASA